MKNYTKVFLCFFFLFNFIFIPSAFSDEDIPIIRIYQYHQQGTILIPCWVNTSHPYITKLIIEKKSDDPLFIKVNYFKEPETGREIVKEINSTTNITYRGRYYEYTKTLQIVNIPSSYEGMKAIDVSYYDYRDLDPNNPVKSIPIFMKLDTDTCQ